MAVPANAGGVQAAKALLAGRPFYLGGQLYKGMSGIGEVAQFLAKQVNLGATCAAL